MADSRLDIIIKARDEATAALKRLTSQLENVEDGAKKSTRSFEGFRESLLGIGAISGTALAGLTIGLKSTIDAYSQAQSSQLGFEATAKKLKVPIDSLNVAAQKLSADGLIPLSTAQAGMQNLMQAGLTDVDKITKLMQNFKDEAVFGKSASIDLATAVSNLSESYKTESSSLGNLSGISENYSMVLEKGAAQLGKRVVDLTEAERAEAKYLGLLQIGAAAAGNSEIAMKSLAGAQAQTNTAFRDAQIAIGEALAPALTQILQAVTPIITKVTEWVKANPELVSQITQITIGVLGMGTALGGIALAINPATLAFAKFIAISAGVTAAAGLIKEAYDNNFLGLKDTTDAAANSFTSFVDTVKKKSEEAYISVEFWWSQWGPVITPTLTELAVLAASVFGKVGDAIKGMWDNFAKPALDGLGDALGTVFGENWAIIGEAAQTFEAAWQNVIKPALNAMKTAWDTDLGGMRTFAVNVFNTIKTIISAFGESIVAVMKTTMILFATPIKATLQALRGDFPAAWNTIKSGLASAWATITGMIKSVMDKILSIFGTSLDGVVSAVTSGFQAVVAKIKEWWDATVAFFGGLPARFTEFGKWMIEGLINGIGSMAGAAVAKVQEVGNGILGALNVFQFGSPSKLTTQYGEWIMEGLTIGINTASGETKEAMQAAMDKLGELLDELKVSYTEKGKEIKNALSDLTEDHSKNMGKLGEDIQKVVGEMKKLKDEYSGFVTGQAMGFGENVVKQEESVAKLAAELQKAQITGGSQEQISDLQTRLAQEQAILEQARGTYLTSEQDLRNKIVQSEQTMQEQIAMMKGATDIQEQARIQARVNELGTRIEFMKIQEQNFSEEQKKFALGVETARRRASMSELEKFLLDLQTKRVEEKTAFDERMKAKAEELAQLQEQTKKEMEIFIRKQQSIKTILDIMQTTHEKMMQEQTRVTADEINKQIDYYNRLAEAAKAAFSAKSSVGVARFAEGGMVGGFNSTSVGNDKIPAMLSAGEVVLNAAQQRNLAGALSNERQSSIVINIEQMIGDDQYAEKLGDMIVKNLALNTTF